MDPETKDSSATPSIPPSTKAVWGDNFAIGRDKSLLKLGASFGLLGLVRQIAMDRLHPHRAAPNDSVNVFREYAASGT